MTDLGYFNFKTSILFLFVTCLDYNQPMFNHKQINCQKSFRNFINSQFHSLMITLQTQLICPHCNTEYKDNNLPRTLTMCGHTFCECCISKMINKNPAEQTDSNGYPFYVQCPQDAAKRYLINDELKVFPKNLALIKMIEAKKVNSSFRDESLNVSKILQKQQIQQDEQTSDLILAFNECKYQQNCKDQKIQSHQVAQSKITSQPPTQNVAKSAKQISQKAQQQQQDELCLLHQKPLEIVCIRDKKKICSKCALFGSHKGHQFKSIEQLQNQKNQCYLSILEIFKQKQETQQRMSNQETEQGLTEILDKKKNLMQGEVRQHFRKLRQQITKQEKIVMKKFQQTYKNTQNKIKALLKVQQSSLHNFSNWEVESFKLLKVLENPELQPKIDALYSKQRKHSKILQKGNQILSEIQEQQKNLVNKVQEILTHLSCEKSNKIFEFIPVFVEIVDSPSYKNQIKSLKRLQNQNSMAISTLQVDDRIRQSVQVSNCSIIEGFNKKFDLIDGSPLLEQSLLEEDKDDTVGSRTSRDTVNQFAYQSSGRIPLRPNSSIINKNVEQDSISCSFIHLELDSAKKIPLKTSAKFSKDQDQQFFLQNSRVSSILTSRPSMILKKENGERPNKKKLKSIKISQKYEKMLQSIYNNTADTIDLTNAQVGDQSMLQICEFIKFSKARTIKLIRNKLTDIGVEKMLPALTNAQILNLSQNNLTEAVIDIFIKNRHGYLSGLKNLILSQNKIIERKHKAKIDQLRAMNIVVSV